MLPNKSHGVANCHGRTGATHSGEKSGLLVSVRLAALGFAVLVTLGVGFDVFVMLICCFDTPLPFSLVGRCFVC